MRIPIQREPGVSPIEEVDESRLVKTEGVVDTDHEHTTWVEYRFPDSDTVVHRSVHVTLKKIPAATTGTLGRIG